jgi:hypothetical protein
MDMVNINGKMGKSMKDSGKKVLKMDQEYGEVPKVTHILDNGLMEKQKDMEFTPG